MGEKVGVQDWQCVTATHLGPPLLLAGRCDCSNLPLLGGGLLVLVVALSVR